MEIPFIPQYSPWKNLIYDIIYKMNKKFFLESTDRILRTDAKIIGFSVYGVSALFSIILAREIKKEIMAK